MKRSLVFLFLLGFLLQANSQTYDTKYTIEYVLKNASGVIQSRMKLYRDGSRMKFEKLDNSGKPDSTRTEIFIFKDEPKIYNIVSNSAGKFGTKNAVDLSYVGMQTGVYILDLENERRLFNSSLVSGSGSVLGMECVKYTIASDGEASSDYYMYQDNLMLKRWVGNAAEGNSIEALNYDNTSAIPESTFTLPAGVNFLN